MLENKDYCDYDTCVALKKLGFNDVTHYFFNKDGVRTPRIPLYEAQKWLREVHTLHIEITYSPACWTGKIYDLTEWKYIKGFTFFESFEDSLHTLIKEAVKILKENETIHE